MLEERLNASHSSQQQRVIQATSYTIYSVIKDLQDQT